MAVLTRAERRRLRQAARGLRATDPSEASFTFGNFRNRRYDDTVIEAFDILNAAAIQQLERRGLVVRRPAPRIMNDSFRRFDVPGTLQ